MNLINYFYFLLFFSQSRNEITFELTFHFIYNAYQQTTNRPQKSLKTQKNPVVNLNEIMKLLHEIVEPKQSQIAKKDEPCQ